MTKIIEGRATAVPIRRQRRVKALTHWHVYSAIDDRREPAAKWVYRGTAHNRDEVKSLTADYRLSLVVRVHCPDMEL